MSDKNPISAIDFAKKIKAKYPDYSEVPDIELAQKMVAKYPEYKDIVVFEAEKKSPVQNVSKAGAMPSAPGFEPFQPPVAVETPSVLTSGGQQQYKEQRAKQTQGIQSALNAYKTVQGENIAPATVEPAPTIRPETQRTGNYAKHLYNKFLEGTGSLANAVTDAAFAAGEFLPTGDPYVESGKLLKDYRQNNASKVRSFLKDQIGAEVDKGLQRKYDEGLVSGAVAGLAGSIPAMVGASATGGGTLFAQMYDAGLQSIEAQPGAKNLPEDVKTIYAGTVGLVTSALEKYGLDRVLKGNGFVNSIVNKIFKSAEGKKLTGDVLENLIDENVKGVAKIFAKGGVRAVDAFTTEFGTGTSQEIATDVSERLLDKATGEPIFNTSNKEDWEGFLRRIARAGVQEGIGGGIMGGGIGMLTAGSKKAVRENQQIINGIDEQLANPELSPEVQEVLLQRKADVQTKVDDLIEQEAETQSKLNSDDLLEAQDLSKQVDKIDAALAQPDIPEPVKADLEVQKQTIEQEIDKVIKRRPKKEVVSAPTPAAPAEKIKVSGTVLESPEALSDFEFATVKLPNGKFAVYETWSGAPISNQYDTEAEVIEAFNTNKGNLTAEAVQTKIDQNAVQKQTASPIFVQPAPETGAKVAQGVSESRLGKPTEESKGVEATPEAGLETKKSVFDQQDSKAEIIVGKQKDRWGRSQVWRERIENAGDILREIASRGENPDVNYLKEKVEKIKNWLLKNEGFETLPENVKTIADVEQSNLKFSTVIDGKDYLDKFHKDVLDETIDAYKSITPTTAEENTVKDFILSLLKGKTKSEIYSKLKEVEDIVDKIQKKGRLQSTTLTAPVPTVSPLVKAETDLESLKSSASKAVKYKASMNRLIEAKKAKQITESEFNQMKQRFDDVMAESKPDKIAEAKSKLAEAKAALDKLKTKAGIASDPKEEAKALYNYHKALVGVAKAYIEVGIKNVKDFAKELGEDISDAIRKAWGEANGGRVLTPEDFDTLTPPIDETLVSDAEVMGITKKQLKQLQTDMGIPEFVPEKNISRAESRVKADRVIERGGFNIADLIAKMKDPNFVPSPFESDLLRSYFISLTSRINSAPTAELISERNELIKLIREAGYRGGAFVQSIDGLIAVEDNLVSFLTEQSEFADLSKAEIAELTEKYNKAQEAIKRLEEMAQKALDKELEKRAKKVISETPRPKVKADFKAERAQIKQDMRAALRKARGLTQATFVPYMNELVAIAPYVRKMVTSYVNEGIYDLKEIVKGIREDLVEDIPDITETDVRDIIAGKYPNPKNTKNYKLAMVRDLETQARLEDKVEKLEAGILETKSPVQKRVRSKEIEDLEAKIKEIKQRYPELTYPTRLEGRKSFYNNKIKQLKAEIAKGDFDPVLPTPPIVLDREALVLKDEYAKFKHEMQERRRKQEYEALSKWQKNLKKARGLADIRRAVMISVDLSIPFRQGVAVMLNPRTAKKGIAAYGEMLSAVKSRKNYDRMMVDLERSPAYLESKDDGIVYNEVGAKISTDEWHQQNPIIDRIPILRDLVKGSEVAAAAWTNYARFELYLKGTKALLAQGKTRENSKQAYEDMAARVMVDTGRGKIPLLKDKAATDTDGRIKQVLSNTLFGPRLYSAIFRKLNPLYYFNPKVDRTVRIEALKDMAGYVSSQILLGLAVAAAGGVVSLDPDDPDFLKARWGKKVVDLTGGQAPYVRTFLRLVRAALMKYDPDISETDAEKYASFATQSTLNFWRNKLAPNTAYVADWFAGSNSIGEDFDPWGIIKVYPMYTEDIVTALKEGSPLDAAIIAPIGVLGLGYQEYTKDVRRARLSTYVQDPAVKSFLKKNKLTVTGDINQEVYDLEAGVNTKMTKEQSDKYEKVWGTEVEAGIKANMEELQKLADKDKANEDKEGYKKKLPSAIGRIKAEATMEAKKQITGVSPQELTIEDGNKKYILSAEQVRKRVKLNQQYIERNQSDYIRDTQDYMKDGLSKELAQRKAMSDLRSAANKESKYVLLDDPDFKNKAIVE